jgi:Right handed beta helix region
MSMLKMTARAVVMAMLLIAGLQGQKLLASDVAVGPVDCLPNLVHYPTIQHAVNAVSPGTTVNVCPGVYHQQVLIGKSLTLQGVANGNAAAAVIYPPLTGLKVNYTDFQGGHYAAQLAVIGAADVIIRNVTVDGSNNLLPCSNPLTLFQSILFSNASGTVSHVVTRNQYFPTAPTCNTGNGIVVTNDPIVGTSDVTIENSSIHDFQGGGIFAYFPGATVKIIDNFISNAGNTNSFPSNGIEIADEAAATISGNTITGLLTTDGFYTSTGFFTFQGATGAITFTDNSVSDTLGAIAIVLADGAIVTSNKSSNSLIGHGTEAVYVCANNTSVTKNTISYSNPTAVFLDNSCGSATTGNVVTSNTINEACIALQTTPGVVGNTLDPNNIVNVNQIRTVDGNLTPCVPSPAVSKAVSVRPRPFKHSE